jgi:hypothetical protein
MRTKTINLYQYDELSEEAKEKALEKLADINIDYGWWRSTYEDAEIIGLKIIEFDIDRTSFCHGDFICTARDCADKLIKEHGKQCETYKTAKAYIAEYEMAEKNLEHDEYGDIASYKEEQLLDDITNEFKRSLLEDYSIILRKEYEYLTGKEAIEESIRANEYEFDENGKLQ